MSPNCWLGHEGKIVWPNLVTIGWKGLENYFGSFFTGAKGKKNECAPAGIKAVMTHQTFALTKESYSYTELTWIWYTIDNKTEVLPSIKVELIIIHLHVHSCYLLFSI